MFIIIIIIIIIYYECTLYIEKRNNHKKITKSYKNKNFENSTGVIKIR